MNSRRRDLLKCGFTLPILPFFGEAKEKHIDQKIGRNYLFINIALGLYPDNFFPKTKGDLNSSVYLKQLSRFHEKMTLFDNFFHPGMSGTNHISELSIFTGAEYPSSNSFKNSVSIDVKLADQLRRDTRFKNLCISRGYKPVSFLESGALAPLVDDPDTLFGKLFVNGDKAEEERRVNRHKSIIDTSLDEIDRKRSSVGNHDKDVIDEYLQGLYELELDLDRKGRWLSQEKPKVDFKKKEHPEYDWSNDFNNMLELSRLAFQTNSTNVISFNMSFSYDTMVNVPGLKEPTGWHQLSHHSLIKGRKPELLILENYMRQQINDFLTKLENTNVVGKNLLDDTTVVLCSNMGDANRHSTDRLPFIVIVGGHNHKQHIFSEEPEHICNLYLELLNQVSAKPLTKFGTSNKATSFLS